METILLEFIDTLDASLKKMQAQVGDGSGFSRLTIRQFQYIDAIHALGEPAISEIAARLKITRASVTPGINKLVGLGYASKTQSSADKRVFHVRLTEAGAALIQARYRALEAYGAFIRSTLSEEEARQFAEILGKLVRVFKNDEGV